ncbi:MAG: CehA/McbA family metallohydrolase [Gemmatimonadetes bacterium]|nr:CehA/McbA family metallohydrolase [Gemmatimonadota bacterium]
MVDVNLTLDPVWDAQGAGWVSADHHFHLNYGGPYDLVPTDLIPMMKGEALDVATPLIANLHDRFESQDLWGWQKPGGVPLIRFGQEIRSHFLGHMGLIETQDLFWPWVWGPGYQVYGTDDRTNGEVLEYAHEKGGLGYYVHPVSTAEPFSEGGRASVPVELVVDAVLGDVDALELVCLWSNPIGTAAVWHRFLNLGLPIAPSAGTDVMTNFYRTMAVGTTRVYANTGGAANWPAYLGAYKAGRSFVTNGPMLDFRVGGVGPGEVVPLDAAKGGSIEWTLDLRTAVPVEQVEVLVNGEVVWSSAGLSQPGHRAYSGRIDLPEAGWIAVRAVGGPAGWPSMDMYPFAHTGATWIGQVGSSDAAARAQSARELMQVLDVSEQQLIAGYVNLDIPKLRARFARARARLEALTSP